MAWLSRSAVVVAIGLGLLAAVLLTLGTVAWRDREQLFARLEDRNELMARVFADRATRNVDSAALALSTISEMLARGQSPESAELRTALSQTLVSLPFLRGVSVVDAEGQILASSDATERGIVIGLDALGPRPNSGRDRLGPFVVARRLSDLVLNQQTGVTPPGVGFVPLLRETLTPTRQRLLLVAQINLDSFITFQQVTMNDPRGASALLSYEGKLLAATPGVPRAVGEDLSKLTPYTKFLPRLEHGQWTGAALRWGPQLAAFRVAATQPLVAVVEVDQEAVHAGWAAQARRLLAAAIMATLLIGVLTMLALRSLRAREHARDLLDQAQRQVARRERELSITIASVQELIFRTDTQGAITFANDRWQVYTGLSLKSASGRPLWEVFDQNSKAGMRALFAATVADGGVRKLQASMTQADAQPRWFDVAVMPLLREGRVVGFAGSAIDVSDFREAERAAAESRDAAEEASRAKSEFVANISHELRTPLQSIIGFSELGLMRGREHTKLAGMFGDINNAGHRMLNLVNDLLDVAKIESSVGTINLERSDLRLLVRSVAGELSPLLGRRQQVLDLQLPSYPLRAKVDPKRFEQVMRNVLANAIKFSPEDSCITVFGEQTDAGELHLAISDQGPGIPPAELEKIFEAFVQSSQTKDGSGGTGLGLAISRKIVEAQGGHIHASNAAAGGAVFHIHLPARGTAETQPAPL